MRDAFAACPRPEHFTNYRHCCECFEHDETLLSRDVETLGMSEVGYPAWDPICFISPDGFAYYLPALARLALSEPDPKLGWYGDQFLFHLCADGPENRRVLACNFEQRRAVRAVLEHIALTRSALVEDYNLTENLFCAIEIWS